MGSLSVWHLAIVGALVLFLFGGKGKISDLMGDFAKGIKSFKNGLSDDNTALLLDHRPAPEANWVSNSQKAS